MQKLSVNGSRTFGWSVGINDENYLVVGGSVLRSGHALDVVYFFTFNHWLGGWSLLYTLRPSNAGPSEIIAGIVSICNEYVVMASYDESREESKVRH